MGSNKTDLTNEEIYHYKKMITHRFIDNPRMSLLFNKNQKNFKKKVFNLVDYCFNIALSVGGVYVANNKKAIVLFYERKKLKKTFKDYFRYLKVIKGISIYNLFEVLKNEREVNNYRLKFGNYIYVWFIAQACGYGKLGGLVEINKMLFDLSRREKLPILFETSDPRLINFYKRVGYEIYKTLEKNSGTIYFFIRNDKSIKRLKV